MGKIMGYSEKETFRMTLRKLFLLYTEYQKLTGTYQEPKTIDDIIPF